jgi:hypothetical protein
MRFPIICLFLFTRLAAQNKITELEAAPGFAKSSEAVGYFINRTGGYVVNMQIADKIVRNLYDKSYHLIKSYDYNTIDLTLNTDFIKTPVFATDLQLETGLYEIYADTRNVIITSLDFENKRDSTMYFLNLKDHENDEKKLAIMPFSKGVRVLSFSNNRDMLYLFQWQENGKADTFEFKLPKSSLSQEEIKKYSKEASVKYKKAFEDMLVSQVDKTSVIGYSSTNCIFYSENKIWLVCRAPLGIGFNLLEIDLDKQTVSSSNIIINDMRENANAKNESFKTPYAVIWNNLFIIRNSSNYFFEYLFYNLTTKQKIREYTAWADESLRKVLHSDFNQIGTWLSGAGEKKLDNEKAYLRKLSLGVGFIIVSGNNKDSITITTGSVKAIEGLEGMLLSMGTKLVGFSLGLTIGNFQIVPYLRMFRNKLVYNHSRFSQNGFELSSSGSVTTALDSLLDNFERRDLKSHSSFIVRKGENYFPAVYDPGIKKFELFTLENGQ